MLPPLINFPFSDAKDKRPAHKDVDTLDILGVKNGIDTKKKEKKKKQGRKEQHQSDPILTIVRLLGSINNFHFPIDGFLGPIPLGSAFVLHLCRPNEDNSIIWNGKVSFSRGNQSSGKHWLLWVASRSCDLSLRLVDI